MDPKAQSFVSNPQAHRCRGSAPSTGCRTQAQIAASACIQCGKSRSTAPPQNVMVITIRHVPHSA